MANARDLISNYSTYTSARELNHSAAVEHSGRTVATFDPTVVSVNHTFDLSC